MSCRTAANDSAVTLGRLKKVTIFRRAIESFLLKTYTVGGGGGEGEAGGGGGALA